MFKFHPLEVVSRYSDPQLQVSKMYSYLLNATQSGQKWSKYVHIIWAYEEAKILAPSYAHIM